MALAGCLSGGGWPPRGTFGTLGEPERLHGHPKGSLWQPLDSPGDAFGSPKGSHLAPWGSHGGHMEPRDAPGGAKTVKLTTVLQF